MFADKCKPEIRSARTRRIRCVLSRGSVWIAFVSFAAILPATVASQSLSNIPTHSADWIRTYRAGVALAKQGRLDEAIADFQNGLQIAPQNKLLLDATGAAYSLKGDLGRAKQYFRECLDADPEFVPARKNLAITYYGMEQYDLGAAEFQKLKNSSPRTRPVANLFLGMISEKKADHVQAVKLLELSGALVDRYPEAVLSLAEAEIELKHIHKAQAALIKFEAARGVTASQHLKAAELYVRLEQNRHALAQLDKASIKDGGLKRVVYERALVLDQMDRSQEALTILKDLAAENPDSDTLNLLAHVAQKRGDLQLAIQSLRQAAKLDPAREDNYLDFSTICADYGNYALALEAADVGLSHIPSSYRLSVQKGVVLENLGRLDAAEEILRKAAQLQNENSVALLSLAIVQTHAGQLEDAEATLTSALERFPDNYYMHYHLGKILVQLQEINPNDATLSTKAKHAFQQAIRSNPSYADSYYQLAKLYMRESSKLAEHNLVECLRLDPKHAPAEYTLARLYLNSGRRTAGQAMVDRFEHQQQEEKLRESQAPRIESAEK